MIQKKVVIEDACENKKNPFTTAQMAAQCMIPKELCVLMAFYQGTAVEMVLTRKRYNSFCTILKEGGRTMVQELKDTGMTASEVADRLQHDIEAMHQEILSFTTYTNAEVLEKLWGNMYHQKKMEWFTLISALLHLKRIKNDNNHGWLLLDYNSSHGMVDDDVPLISVHGSGNGDKLLKKLNKLKKEYNP